MSVVISGVLEQSWSIICPDQHAGEQINRLIAKFNHNSFPAALTFASNTTLNVSAQLRDRRDRCELCFPLKRNDRVTEEQLIYNLKAVTSASIEWSLVGYDSPVV